MPTSPKKRSTKQVDRFRDAASEHGADEDEEAFKRKLKDVAMHRPKQDRDSRES